MTPEMLETKLRQCMKPGMPYYLREIQQGIGLDLVVKPETLERRIRDVKSVYWRRFDANHKVYYIDSNLPPCKFAKFHDKLKGAVEWVKSLIWIWNKRKA